MLVDVDYRHYRIGACDEANSQFGPQGTVTVSGNRVLVSTFTQSGPVSLRILVGDFAPGAAEDGWRGEWESVQDVVVDVIEGLEVRSWELSQAEPPSGPVVPTGRWRLRFHARGEAKVRAEDGFTEAPLEENLILLWPEDAEPGESPVWDEVSGIPVEQPFRIREFSNMRRVKTPTGYYRLTWSVEGLSIPAVLPQEPAFVTSGESSSSRPSPRRGRSR